MTLRSFIKVFGGKVWEKQLEKKNSSNLLHNKMAGIKPPKPLIVNRDVQTQVTKCGYDIFENEFVMDQIVVGIHSDQTRQKLWTEDEMDLEKAKKLVDQQKEKSKKFTVVVWRRVQIE